MSHLSNAVPAEPRGPAEPEDDRVAHGLAYFKVQELVDKAEGALKLIDVDLEGDGHVEATQEVLRVVLENQIRIAETLELIKQEFDKFEEGLGKIL